MFYYCDIWLFESVFKGGIFTMSVVPCQKVPLRKKTKFGAVSPHFCTNLVAQMKF